MHPHRRRKKRHNYGIRTVEIERGPNGFGFTISGQQPCILSCIVNNSPADQAGLRAGDFLISVNGLSVSKSTHDTVVKLIGSSIGPIKMSIAEYYYSDSSDEELDVTRINNNRKPKYMHKPRGNRSKEMPRDVSPKKSVKNCEPSSSVQLNEQESLNTVEYKVLVGYLGTIEMPKQLLPNSRLQTVCSCIRKLRQEKRTPTAVLMTVLPACLTLKNINNQILAIYPSNRVVYISSTSDKDSRYFGLVTSAIMDENTWSDQKIEISNSCHVFVTDPKLVEHKIHVKKAETFNITCTPDIITGNCLEFPKNALYIVSLVQNMYRLQSCTQNEQKNNYNLINDELIANSPQPSASSNSDSGIGFRDDCANISDRILVVEFPAHRPPPVLIQQPQRPTALDGSIDFDFSINNVRAKTKISPKLLNIRACDDKLYENPEKIKENYSNRLTVRAMPDPIGLTVKNEEYTRIADIDTGQIYTERPVDVPTNFKTSIDNLSVHSFKSCDLNTIKVNNKFKKDAIYKQNAPDNINEQINEPNEHFAYKQLSSEKLNEYEQISDFISKQPKIPSFRQSSTENLNAENNHFSFGQLKSDQESYSLNEQVNDRKKNKEQFLNEDQTMIDQIIERKQSIDDKTQYDHFINDRKQKNDFTISEQLSHKKTDIHDDNFERNNYYESRVESDFIFKQPKESEYLNKQTDFAFKQTKSCENLSEENILNYKLSPKVYGVCKPTLSCESLQDLCGWMGQDNRRTGAVSEPDVRIESRRGSNLDLCENNIPSQNCGSDGAASWAASFEKLLEDPIALQTFAEFLKKEFSAENIYFWTACERYRRLTKPTERSIEAQKIHRRHLCVGAPEPVNVDSQGRQFTNQQLQDAQTSLFEQAQKQIFNLMKFDSYPRFLKSEIYKQCLNGDIEFSNLEPGLNIFSNSPNKLKKSLSNAEDRRRKSLLPWHRKNRSKSKDRGETEYNLRKEGNITPVKNGHMVHSSQSSLTSLDLAMSCSLQDGGSSKGSHDELTLANPAKGALCRVLLNDGATTVVQIRPTETVRQLANRLLDKRGLQYTAYEVFISNQTKPLDPNELSIRLSGSEVTIEQRVVFKLDLPNRKVISVKSKCSKRLVDVLRPILHKYGFGLDTVSVTSAQDQTVDVNLEVTTVDGCRLNIQKVDDASKSVLATSVQKKASLDEITNKVFEQLLNEKSETNCIQPPHIYDKCSVKSEDWGSEHSSGIFGRFLRRDSQMADRKKKCMLASLGASRAAHKGSGSAHASAEDIAHEHHASKKPLIAKWRPGAKLQLACSESDELYEGLKRAQRSRLEDQRGTEINFELPDFLKDKENQQTTNKFRKIQQSETRFYDNETENGFSSLENSMVENNVTLKLEEENEKYGDPPPLPPKPKVLPIKPSNWGQSALFKAPRDVPTKTDRGKHTLYLEQPTSSFV